jgi:hypothetical protein
VSTPPDARTPQHCNREELLGLLEDAAKNWLAHDGLWFLEVEKSHGIDQAIALDKAAWATFTVLEARRIMKRLGLEPGGGIPALMEALGFRLYAYLNRQEVVQTGPDRCVLTMNTCRVQAARKSKGLPDFPCKEVGVVEYSGFAGTIDPRIRTTCLVCPPDDHPENVWCSWEFVVERS